MQRGRTPSRFLCSLILPLLTPAALLAATQSGDFDPDPDLPRMEGAHSSQMDYSDLPPGDTMEERIVRAAYKAMERMVNADGKDLEFKLGDFQRYDPPSYPSTRFGDIFTINPPVRLNITRSEQYRSENDGPTTLVSVLYKAGWEVRDPSSFIEEKYLAATISDFLQLHFDQGTLDSPPAHIVSYAVAASMLERTQSYRAISMWFSDDPKNGKLVISDPVTDRVAEALAERGPVMSEQQRGALDSVHLMEEFAEAEQVHRANPDSCLWDTKTYVYPLARATGTQGHHSGNHFVSANFSFSCTCATNCLSVCQPSLGSTACTDSGSTGPYDHVTHTRDAAAPHSEVEGNITAAQCAAGWACFVEQCPLTGCGGGSISLIGGFFGLSFDFSGRALWDGQRDFSGHCGRCTEVQPVALPRRAREGRGPFHRTIEDPRGGGGGGGGGGCRRETFECHPVFSYNYCGDMPRPCLIEYCEDVCTE
jgi:hypothetical protein